MRYILLVLFAFVTTFASAQVQYLGSPTTTVRNRGNFVSDSLFYLPKRQKLPSDTGALRYQISDSALYVWTGSAWRSTGTAGSAITGSGVAGYMPEFTTSTNLDTTRLYHSAGRFAIGSTTTTNGVFNVYGGAAYFDTSLKVGTQTLFADEGKNEVYVNTTSDAGAYPLQVGGSINIADNSSLSSAGREILFMGTSGTTYLKSSGAGTAIIFQPNNVSDSVMYYGTDYELKIATSADAGNYKLQVAGSVYATGNINVAGADRTISNISNNVLAFGTNNTERMRLKADGEFLIGTTSDAGAYALQVAGSIYNTTGAVFAYTSGSVGIGTVNPAYTLDVSGTMRVRTGTFFQESSGNAFFDQVPNPANAAIIRQTRGTQIWWTGVGANADANWNVYDATAAAFRLTLNTSGELIINTTTDAGAYALQVAGAIYNTTTITTGAPTSGSAKPWRLGEAATVSPTSPNRTIRVEIDGTVYYIHAKTTND